MKTFDEFINETDNAVKYPELRDYFDEAQTVSELTALKKKLEKQMKLGNTKKYPEDVISAMYKERMKQLPTEDNKDSVTVDQLNAALTQKHMAQQRKHRLDARATELGPINC